MALNCSHFYLSLVFKVSFLKAEVESLSFWNQSYMVGIVGGKTKHVFKNIIPGLVTALSGVFPG